DCLTVTPNPQVDISLTKGVSNATPGVGDQVTFTLTVRNAANFTNATGVTVKDLLPAGYAYVSDNGAGSYVSGTGVWTVGAVNQGANKQLTITARVRNSGSYQNIAEVTAATSSNDFDSTPNNFNGCATTPEDDEDCITPTPTDQADLQGTKNVDDSTTLTGQTVTFTVTVKNGDDATHFSNATGVHITDTLGNGY